MSNGNTNVIPQGLHRAVVATTRSTWKQDICNHLLLAGWDVETYSERVFPGLSSGSQSCDIVVFDDSVRGAEPLELYYEFAYQRRIASMILIAAPDLKDRLERVQGEVGVHLIGTHAAVLSELPRAINLVSHV